MKHAHAPLTLEAAAADAEVDVATYCDTLKAIDHDKSDTRPDSVRLEDHDRVLLALSLPPPPL